MSSGLPRFIRYFADTSDTPLGRAALEYCKSLCRIAPVRVVSLSGGFYGPWLRYTELGFTPMDGTYVNAVCCHPSKWVMELSVPMPEQDIDLEAGPVGDPARPTEVASGSVELRTAGVRNVLFVVNCATTPEQRATQALYEAVVFDLDHAVIRAAVLGEPGPVLGVYR